MSINTSALNSTLQAKVDALDAATDTKEVLLLSKALDAAAGSTAVSDVLGEGVVQVNNVSSEGSAQIANVQNEGATQRASVGAVLGDYTPTTGFKTVGGQSVVGSGDIATIPAGGTVGQVVTNTGSGLGGWADAAEFLATDTLLWSGSSSGGTTVTLTASLANFKFITFYTANWRQFHTMSVASFRNNINGDGNGHMLAGYSTEHMYVKYNSETTVQFIQANMNIARIVGVA